MQTPIGQRLGDTLARRAACGALATAVVFGDYALVWRGHATSVGLRTILPVLTQVILVLLARGNLESAGQRWLPIQGLRYWVRTTLLIGAAVGASIGIALATAALLRVRSPIYILPPRAFGSRFLDMCVFTPVLEEAIYRLAFCTAAVAAVGPRATIVLSGAAFAALHVLYGNAGPDNFIAGFFLAWAYLKSGTILVPIVLHALGNLCVLLAWVGMWYWRMG